MDELEMVNNIESLEPETDGLIVSEDVEEIKSAFFEIKDDVEGLEGEEIVVIGDPYAIAPYLDSIQGDNSYDCYGCCGLNSCSNLLVMAGIESSEEEIVGFAVENGLCNYDASWYADLGENGGTYSWQQEAILEAYGLDVTVYSSELEGGSLEDIASSIESGYGVTVSVNAGVLWDDATYYGDGNANHQITITGVERDAETGEVVGFVICDSGRGLESDACRSVSLETMEECYTNIEGSAAIITDEPIR